MSSYFQANVFLLVASRESFVFTAMMSGKLPKKYFISKRYLWGQVLNIESMVVAVRGYFPQFTDE